METTAADELMAKITTRKLETTNKSLIEDIEGKHTQHTLLWFGIHECLLCLYN